MWIITGPFDGEEAGNVAFQKSKLLKTDRKYVLGRKQRDLVVNHKKVSHDHAEFTVGAFTQDDMKNSSKIPKLEVYNNKAKTLRITRGSNALIVNPLGTQELHDGDVIEIVSSPEAMLSVRWSRLCIFIDERDNGPQVSLDACAQLGINIADKLVFEVTHHLVDEISMSCSIAHSLLLATQLVRSDWLQEIVRLGNLSREEETTNARSLESQFSLPLVVKYRPRLSPSLAPSLKVLKVWEPNEERLKLLGGYRFVLFGERGREIDAATREMILAGGGEYEGFNVSGGRSKLHQVLAKGMRRILEMAERGKGLVVVADEQLTKTAIGSVLWKELSDEIRSFQLEHVAVQDIVQAVITLNFSCFASRAVEDEQPAADYAPNTYPDEPSIARGSQSAHFVAPLREKSPSTTHIPNAEISGGSDDIRKSPGIPARKGLTRRAKAAKPIIVGIDDPSTIIDVDHATVPPVDEPPKFPSVPESQPPRTSRLKRRAGTASRATAPSISFDIEETEGEPPLKKYRALFEASDPDRNETGRAGSVTQHVSSTTDDVATSGSGSQLTRPPSTTRPSKRNVDTLISEDANPSSETMSGSDIALRTRKRTAENLNETQVVVDVDSMSATDAQDELAPTAKRAKLDTGPNRPDRDEAFLKAIASTKKGRRLEDTFDREFNELKISKPDLREDAREGWSLLADFGDERDIRGNFMVIVEMDIHKNRRPLGKVTQPDWQLRENFKKFKKRVHQQSRVVELVVHEEGDYGTGSSYWKENYIQPRAATFRPSGAVTATPREPPDTDRNQEELQHPFVVKQLTKAPAASPSEIHANRHISAPVTTKRASRPTRKRELAQPLFLDSDDGGDQSQNDTLNTDAVHEAQTTSSRDAGSRKLSRRAGKNAGAVIADDDSDDGATMTFRFRSSIWS